MTTNDRARELANEWHCEECGPRVGCSLALTVAQAEITAILDVLVEARNLLARRTLVDDRNPWPLIEKIDAILGEKR